MEQAQSEDDDLDETVREIPLNGYGPDLDPVTPGFFSLAYGVEFTSRGMKLQRKLTSEATGGASIQEGALTRLADGTNVFHLAAARKLYWKNGTTLTDVSPGLYSASTDQWSFAQWGNYTIACNGTTDGPQFRDASGATPFAIFGTGGWGPNAPAAAAIAVTWGPSSQPLVALCDYTTGGVRYPSGIWSSHRGGPSLSWVPDIATGAWQFDYIGPGPIRAAAAYNDDLLVWTPNETWLLRWVGVNELIDITKISSDVGCVGMYARKMFNGVMYWVGRQGLFYFDGSRPRKVNIPIQDYLVRYFGTYPTYTRYTQLVEDSTTNRLILVLRSSTRVIQAAYSINMLNNKVGQLSTWDRIGAMDKGYWFSASTMYSESGLPFTEAAQFTLNPMGDYETDTNITRVQFRFADQTNAPPTSIRTDHVAANDPDPSVSSYTSFTTATVTASPWRCDVNGSGKWHYLGVYWSATHADNELIAMSIDMPKPAGRT